MPAARVARAMKSKLLVNQQAQFTAYANDQLGRAVNPPVSWSVTGGDSISPSGLFTAGNAAGGPYTVTASLGGVKGSASVSIASPLNCIVVTPNLVTLPTGGTQQLQASAYDQSGNLMNPQPTFSWSVTGANSLVVDPNNSANATLTAGNAAGPYTITVTANGQTAQTQVNVTTDPTVLESVTDLRAYATGSGRITLYWTPVANATGYNVYRGTYSGGENYYPPVNGAAPLNPPSYSGSPMDMYTDSSLTNGTGYYYTVKPVFTIGEGQSSNEDYDVPDPSAIPWDSRNPSAINTAIRNQFANEEPNIANLRTVGPDGSIYDDSSGAALPPEGVYDPDTNQLITPSGDAITMFNDAYDDLYYDYGMVAGGRLRSRAYQGLSIDPSQGPYRRIRSTTGFRGVQGQITLPGFGNINGSDTANIYMGQHSVVYGGGEVDAGLQSNKGRPATNGHPAVPSGWGLVMRIGGPYYVKGVPNPNPHPRLEQEAFYVQNFGHRYLPADVVTLSYHAYGTTPNNPITRVAMATATGAGVKTATAGPTYGANFRAIQMKRLVAIAQSIGHAGVNSLTHSSLLVPVWNQIQLEQANGVYTNWTTANTAVTPNGAYDDGSYDGGNLANVFWTPSTRSLYTDEEQIGITIN